MCVLRVEDNAMNVARACTRVSDMCGSDGFLEKPITPSALRAAVRAYAL